MCNNPICAQSNPAKFIWNFDKKQSMNIFTQTAVNTCNAPWPNTPPKTKSILHAIPNIMFRNCLVSSTILTSLSFSSFATGLADLSVAWPRYACSLLIFIIQKKPFATVKWIPFCTINDYNRFTRCITVNWKTFSSFLLKRFLNRN